LTRLLVPSSTCLLCLVIARAAAAPILARPKAASVVPREAVVLVTEMVGMARERAVVKFLINVENSYNDHPYHSSWHAADVVGTMAYFFCHGYFKRSLSPVHQIIGLLAAASHDVDHDAKTNKFHTLAKTPIGISCAESNMELYHIARAKQILKLPGCD